MERFERRKHIQGIVRHGRGGAIDRHLRDPWIVRGNRRGHVADHVAQLQAAGASHGSDPVPAQVIGLRRLTDDEQPLIGLERHDEARVLARL